jgi:ABC-type nitrate/sulfonate/bicarbonate transport system permease component
MGLELFTLRRVPRVWVSVLLGFSCIGVILLIWYAVTRGQVAEYRVVSPDFLPSPRETVGELLKRVFTGFGLAILIGVPLGMIAGSWRAVHSFLSPLVIFGRNVPIAALIPLTVLWFGIEEKQKVMFIFIATVPFIFSDAAAAVISIHQRYVETAQTLGATSLQIFRKVLVPLALPDIYISLRHLFGLAFGYIMLAEVINPHHGLGHLIKLSEKRGLFEHIYLILIIIAILAFLIDRTLVFLQRGLFPYRKDA